MGWKDAPLASEAAPRKPKWQSAPLAREAAKDNSFTRGVGLGVEQVDANIGRLIGQVPVVGPAVNTARTFFGQPTTDEAYQANREARANNTSTAGQITGNVIGTLPTLLLPGGPLVQGGASGAALSEADTLGGVVADAGIGALASGAINTISKAVAPKLTPFVQRLINEGIPLTPGQAFGGKTRYLEELAMSVPGVRQVIQSAQDRGTEQLNRTVIDRALKNIGLRLPKDLPTGREAVAFAADAVSDAYNNLLPGLVVQADAPFQNALTRIVQQADSLPADGGRNFRALVGQDVIDALQQGGTLAGEGLKTLESRLSRLSGKLKGSSDSYQQMTGDVVGELLDELRAAVFRSNPGKAAELKSVNRAFAELARVERAAGAAGNSTGTFTAKQYQSAVRQGDNSSRKAQFARGRAMGQDLSDAAADVLPNRLPDSGTVTRAIPAAVATAAGSGGLAGFGPLALGAGALALPYTGVGQKAVGVMLRNPGPARNFVGRLLDAGKVPISVAAPALIRRREQ